jgi:hypothetical protein
MCAANLKRRLAGAWEVDQKLHAFTEIVADGKVEWWRGIAEVESRAEVAMLTLLVERGAAVVPVEV